jgi:major membrane immunogen (membrane-anchored lipoprotein)
MKLFLPVGRFLLLLTTVTLVCLGTVYSQGTSPLTFTTIPYSDPEFLRPGAGAEQWNDQNLINIPVEGTNTRRMDMYWRFNWNHFETTQGNYTWTYFDNIINQAINNGQKFGFGIMSCYPDGAGYTGVQSYDGGNSSYPQYLHNMMQSESVKDWKTTGSGQTTGSGSWVPNWNSPSYHARLLALHQALNAHLETASYNGVRYKDVINYIDIRGYGAWGEWHSAGIINTMDQYPAGTRATAAALKTIIDAHVQGFPNFPLVTMMSTFDANYLNNTYNPAEVAYHALTVRNNWGLLGWRRDNWGATDNYVRAYTDQNTRSFNGMVFSGPIMERWKYAPVIGEPPGWGASVNGCMYDDLEAQVRRYHAVSFGNGNYVYPQSFSDCMKSNVRAASKAAGYRHVVEGGSMSTSITTGSPFPITLNWKNVGITPTYDNWDIVFELKNSGGATVWSGTSALKLKLFLPQTNATPQTDNFTVPTSVPAGTYTLNLVVKDPTGFRQPLPLAITGRKADGSYTLRSVSVTPGNGQTNNPPTANAGANKTITLPVSSTTLSGSGSTDADGSIASYQWQQVSGPTTSVLSATTTAAITVSSLQAGVYTYRLTVTDDDNATAATTVTVTVNNATANQPPVANAGANKAVTLPANSTTLSGVTSSDADGTITTHLWQQVNGPSASTLSATNTANITVSNLQVGVYTYRLTVTDNDDDTDEATVTVTVNAAPVNQAPDANAGANRSITLPASSATLNGSGSSDADGTIATYLWQQTAGPSASVLSATNTANITVSNLQAGVYTYRLRVSDNDGATDEATVTVTVNAPANQAPEANAGANRRITLPVSSATLNGSGSSDADGTIAIYFWEQTAGPSSSVLSATNTANITVSNLQAGVYTYRLTVTDNDDATATDVVTVTVNAAPANQAPEANAGANRTITLPTASTTLNGSGSSDGDGTIASYLWEQTAGPSASVLSAINTANITVSNLQAGVYSYRLTVTDNDNVTATDMVTVTVNNAAANQVPNANAGANRTITLPVRSSALNGSGSSDADGTVAGYLWEQTGGPSASTLSATNTASITVGDLVAGIYTYRLTVTDNDGAIATDIVRVTVNAAVNEAPVANAGANRTITLPTNSINLNGSASADADGTIASYLWQQVTGPAASTLSATNSANIIVSNLQPGVYTYRLTVRDNDNATATDVVTVTVNAAAANQAPVANAGANRTITLPTNSVNLNGSASADADGTIAGYLWQQLTGPSASTLSSTTAANIAVSNLRAGVYTYRLTVRDNDNATANATVAVTVNAAVNQAPVANAGANRTVTLPAKSTTLSGAASSDPDGTITSYLWQQVSGPSASALSATNGVNITVSNLQLGVYTYRLTVRDNNNASATATVTVTVNNVANRAPIAKAGSDKVVLISENKTTLTAEESSDPDGRIVRYRWQQLSGPAASTLSSSSTASIEVSNLQLGDYVYRVTVTDDKNATATTTVKVAVIDNFRNYDKPFAVYPNPAQDIINIRLLSDKPSRSEINIFDMGGKQVLVPVIVNKPVGAFTTSVNVSALKPGSYVVYISAFGVKKMTAKFLKL